MKDSFILALSRSLNKSGIILLNDASDLFLVDSTDNKLELVLSLRYNETGLPGPRKWYIECGGNADEVCCNKDRIFHILIIEVMSNN